MSVYDSPFFFYINLCNFNFINYLRDSHTYKEKYDSWLWNNMGVRGTNPPMQLNISMIFDSPKT